jgi:ADP-heptose:LPS heptosyltransferase
VKRIAIYRTCGIGDAVQLTPLLQQVRMDRPHAHITLFVNEDVEPLFRGCPFLDECTGLPPKLTRGPFASWGNLPLWRKIAAAGPCDIFLDLAPGWRNSIGLPLVRAKIKGGFQSPGWKPIRLFTHPLHVARSARDTDIHQSEDYLRLWQTVSGMPDAQSGYDMRYLLGQAAAPADFPVRFLCLAPGTGSPFTTLETKRWPDSHWLRLAVLLREAGWSVVWLGSKSDQARFALPPGNDNLMGKTDLLQTAQAIGCCSGLIGNDSGMFHLALGLHRKAAAFFGPTNPRHVGPFRTDLGLVLRSDLPCVPCHQPTCEVAPPPGPVTGRPFCMAMLTPESVLARLLAFFDPPKHTLA